MPTSDPRIARPETHPAGRSRRATLTGLRATSTVGALVVAGALVGTAIAPGDQATGLAYTCQFPSGQQQVMVGIAATFPEAGAVGEPIQPGDVAVTVSLPREAIPAEATSVAGTAGLTAVVSQNGTSVTVEWSGLGLPSTPTSDQGELVLTAAGAVASVTVGEAGVVVVLAGDLGLDLALSTADGTTSLAVACALDPDQDATLATIPVPEADTPPSSGVPESDPPRTSPGGGIQVGPSPDGSGTVEPLADPEIPPECGAIPVPPRGRVGCTYVTGYSNVRKLNGSIKVEAGLVNVGVARPTLELPFLRADNPAELVGGAFPPMTGTFLTFGFMPIRATMELAQIGPMNIHTEGLAVAPFTFSVTASSQLSARIRDVTVNGVPLDVGPNCRTAEPIDTVLTGGTPEYTNILLGGPLAGIVEIPPFTGCGVTEDLNPLLTGTVSGPENYVKVAQGTLCVPIDPRSPCPPRIPQVPPPGSSS